MDLNKLYVCLLSSAIAISLLARLSNLGNSFMLAFVPLWYDPSGHCCILAIQLDKKSIHCHLYTRLHISMEFWFLLVVLRDHRLCGHQYCVSYHIKVIHVQLWNSSIWNLSRKIYHHFTFLCLYISYRKHVLMKLTQIPTCLILTFWSIYLGWDFKIIKVLLQIVYLLNMGYSFS